MAKWKSFGSATAADNVSKAMAQAAATRDRVAYPFQPDYYGAGRQPTPRSSAFLEHYARPIGNLIPDVRGDGGALDPRMSGAVDPDQLSPADQAKLRREDGSLPSRSAKA